MNQLFALVDHNPLGWGLFSLYLLVTTGLAIVGHRQTTGMKSFALGNGHMHPVVVGITLAASIASTATFVINPGFVYVHGVSAFLHLGVAAGAGVIVGLVVLSPGFRRIGATHGAITLPHWVGQRFQSRAASLFFSFASLLSFTFVVLIVGGLALVMNATLGLSTTAAAALVVVFVFGYVFVGGATAHAYTNTVQGALMVVVSILLIGSGLDVVADDPLARLAAIDPNLAAPINPVSPLFGSIFSVWIAGFLIGFAVVCQPHILTKALYVKNDRDVRRYLAVTIAVSLVFSGLLLIGFYARLAGLEGLRSDAVVATWITTALDPTTAAFVTVAILAAGMSTLDGLLVALSSTIAHDLFLPLAPARWLAGKDEAARGIWGQRVGQVVLVAMGAAAFVVTLDPPALLGIFGQIGVYGVVAASAIPVIFGVFVPRATAGPVLAAAVVALAVHLLAWLGEASANPAVTASWGILASAIVASTGVAWTVRSEARAAAASPVRGDAKLAA